MLLFSPAKLNLFFHVLGKRIDGYHEVATIMVPISLGDWLEIEIAEEDQFVCNDPTIPTGNDNLIWQAVNLFRQESGKAFHVAISLKKLIPIGAGLGGGSSNAATTLFALNELVGNPFSVLELSGLAAQLGSDVAFFLSLGPAFCTGRGEIIAPIPSFSLPHLWVAKPKCSLSTAKVYQNFLIENLCKRDLKMILLNYSESNYLFFNDLEEAALRLEPSLKDLKRDLQGLGFMTVIMTGSGTAFFCLGEVLDPYLEQVSFFSVEILTRTEGSWWKKEKENISKTFDEFSEFANLS
jgi:4-diphosphocytidyl-2-C-methyl-D-erythritol kinase